jgi:hypothetical protein
MNEVVNKEGFKKAMKAGKTWITLDCQLSELPSGMWYYEIEKHTFYGEHPNWLKEGKYGDAELLAHGEDVGPEFKFLATIWDNFIAKEEPDEYFVDQDSIEFSAGVGGADDTI